MKVIKRTGETVDFNSENICKAIGKAIDEVGEFSSGHRWDDLSHEEKSGALNCFYAGVKDELMKCIKDSVAWTVEEIQDAVEQVLMKDEPTIARAYIIYRQKHTEKRELEALTPDSNAIADYIHPSKYARYQKSLGRRETYIETANRVELMHLEKFPDQQYEIKQAFDLVRLKKILPSMRSMQFAGDAIRGHNARLYNCSYTLIDRPEVFCELLYLLLCGCGCGFSVQKQHVIKIPKLSIIDKTLVKHCAILDSITGWADALNELVSSFINGYYVEFSFNGIRPEGSPLKSSGGKAPGHTPLAKMLSQVKDILLSAQGRHLKPIEAYDICCYAAEAVLAGGIRRSSLSALFSKDDEEMMFAKDKKNFQFEGENSHRAMSNNSAVFLRDDCTEQEFIDVMNINSSNYGDPGFVFLDNLDHGFNPCFEIGMYPVTNSGITGWSFCNLTEINVAACATPAEFLIACQLASIIGTLQAGYTSFKYLGPASQEIAERDALIGVSMTGIMDNPVVGEDMSLIRTGVGIVNQTNFDIAEKTGINPARSTTCIKPSGTASLELGCVGSGVHAHHAKRYFRRVTANPMEIPAQHFKKYNPHMVEEKPNGDWCLTFPVKAPEEAIVNADVEPVEFLHKIFDLYDNWIAPGRRDAHGPTHNISATVTFRPESWGDVLTTVWDNRGRVTAMSFLPESSDKGIPFMPREEVVTEEDWVKWKHLIENYNPVDYTAMNEEEDNTYLAGEIACSGGSCEITHRTKFYKGGLLIWGEGKFRRTEYTGYDLMIRDLFIGDDIQRRINTGIVTMEEAGTIMGFGEDKITKARYLLINPLNS